MTQGHNTTVVVHAPDSNSFGTAGFILSLLGILTCGFLSPLAMLLSFIGLFKSPRGFAFAGFLLSGGGALILAFFGFAFVMGMVGVGSVHKAAEKVRQERAAQEAAAQIQLDTTTELPPVTDPPIEPAKPAPRTFKDTTGKFKVVATLKEIKEGKVVLVREDGRELSVPLEKLSDEDRRWISENNPLVAP